MAQILVDCGDFGSKVTPAEKMKVTYLLRGMAAMGYDAINLAERDLQYGREYLREMRALHDLPFVSANVYIAGTGERFAPPYIVENAGSLRVGIFGVVRQPLNQKMVSTETGFEIRDPFAEASQAVNELKGKCDVIIALAHLGFEGSSQLAQDLPGIDIVVSGHGWNLSRSPVMVGPSCLMQPGSKGKYLGQIDFALTDGKCKIVNTRMVSLDRKIVDDQQLASVVAEYDQGTLEKKPGTN